MALHYRDIVDYLNNSRISHRISKDFLMPAITYRTAGKERSEILDRFRSGT